MCVSKFHLQVPIQISGLIYVLEFMFWVVIEKWEQRIEKENREREREERIEKEKEKEKREREKEREENREFLEELAWSIEN